jgi:predicted negative regulator of RcsB-dependent stress response
MATHLDLEEQEQLAQLKHFWNEYGNLITWVLILVLGAFAAWNGWQWWQREQAAKAGALYDALDRAAQEKDAARVARAFADLKDRYGGTT